MVFFNCNACGEALKKNQVEKHVLRCYQCQSLSCVDCGKDFWGDEYQTHTKCMTENEKYCGKNYVPKLNKGEVKQEQWTEKVQSAIEKSASNPKLRDLLERLKDYPNIPRKKPKFENFLKNSLRVASPFLVTQVWDLLMAAAGNTNSNNNSTGDGTNTSEKAVNGDTAMKVISTEEKEGPTASSQSDSTAENSEEKLSKRERKEERRKKANKKEKKDLVVENVVGEKKEGHRKGKKRKHVEEEQEENDCVNSVVDVTMENGHKNSKTKEETPKKKKKNTDAEMENGYLDEETKKEETPKKKMKKAKFQWESTIVAVLQAKGEMPLKKLRKKVLNEFAAQDGANYAEENLRAKFDKKVQKLSQVKVFKDRVKLR